MDYIDAISEMIDVKKLHDASEAVFPKFSAAELFRKRARRMVAKMMRLQWTSIFDGRHDCYNQEKGWIH